MGDGSGGWFSRVSIGEGIDMLTEPHVHPYMRANIFHLRGRDRDLVVDTGMGLARLSEALDLTPGKPTLALATHIHLDHVGSLHEFEERAGPASEAAGFATMPDELTFADWFRSMDDPVERPPHEGWDASGYTIKPAPLTMALGEGDRVDLGGRSFTVLHLPGHSPDSIALFDEADGLFFAGDAIYDDMLIDDLHNSDRAAYRRTMERLLELPIRRGLGGHGPEFDAARMRVLARAYLEKTEA
jgi:glyoxylase-like metal-dependent hydrolase (beta-lactamase superfamily II)